jgi:predicted transposase YbfD/YdcC
MPFLLPNYLPNRNIMPLDWAWATVVTGVVRNIAGPGLNSFTKVGFSRRDRRACIDCLDDLEGSRATTEKSNEKTAIPELLSVLALTGCIVTIDAMGTQANIAQAVRDREADYVLAVKDNQPKLAESIQDFMVDFAAQPQHTPHWFWETVEKDHGRLEICRCYAFAQLDCLHQAQPWPDLKSFAVIDAERSMEGKTTRERRLYISSLAPDAQRIAQAVRAHWAIENRLHCCMDVIFPR